MISVAKPQTLTADTSVDVSGSSADLCEKQIINYRTFLWLIPDKIFAVSVKSRVASGRFSRLFLISFPHER